MSLFIASLNSGSNGNSYYIGNDNEAVLVDAGISCRETEIRMKRLGLAIEKVKAIFISHEHKDHITGLSVLSKKYQLPVYITEGTQKNAKLGLEKKLVTRFAESTPVQVGKLLVTAFRKNHDADDPHSFIVASDAVTVGIFTDIGRVCKPLIHHFKQCHAAFLESNYDEEMLQNGGYPYYLKQRITNGSGHLSNVQALELFKKHKPAFMSHVILSHLSKHNNNPELVHQLFTQHAGTTNVVIASRDEESAIYHITNKNGMAGKIVLKRNTKKHETQLSLF